ncbi:integrase core domain-containing protein [Paraburkholderia pallida]|uniref:Integrase catalytic domain-containing protein n=1 Tax=Paraburkholderia pallida TaxID=2547399 RepID=A0A4P7D690_9BURK|nr:hypothetical protein E1956_45325 [Paraburkholderia pallida]
MGARTCRQTAVRPSVQADGKRAHREPQRPAPRRVIYDVRKRIEAWLADYNSVRPHSALGLDQSGNCINRNPDPDFGRRGHSYRAVARYVYHATRAGRGLKTALRAGNGQLRRILNALGS